MNGESNTIYKINVRLCFQNASHSVDTVRQVVDTQQFSLTGELNFDGKHSVGNASRNSEH